MTSHLHHLLGSRRRVASALLAVLAVLTVGWATLVPTGNGRGGTAGTEAAPAISTTAPVDGRGASRSGGASQAARDATIPQDLRTNESTAAPESVAKKAKASSTTTEVSTSTTRTPGPGAQTAQSPPIALGVYTTASPEPADFDAFSQLVGRAPAIVMWYQSWSEPLFYYSQMGMVAQDGATPLITWDPQLANGSGVPLSQIVTGNYDSYIRTQALAASSWHTTIYIRLAHEMNLPGSLYGPGVNGNTPALFIAAWQHVIGIFRSVGATNVRWVWSPNVDCEGKCPFQAFYPGDSWVDWVALDGYNYATVDNTPWLSFESVFESSYDELASLTKKPMMVAETSSTESGGDKAAWIAAALTQTLPHAMPLVRALVWFNVDKETNWVVNSSPTSLQAFRTAVDQPLFGGRLPS